MRKQTTKLEGVPDVAVQRVVGRLAQYLYEIAAKKTHKTCKDLIPWERVNLATRTGFRRLARWAISQGIKMPSNIPSSATPQAGLEPRKRNGGEQ